MARDDQEEWERLLAYGQARFRAKLQADGLDPDGMSEDEMTDYIDRVIHEYRAEQRTKAQPD